MREGAKKRVEKNGLKLFLVTIELKTRNVEERKISGNKDKQI